MSEFIMRYFDLTKKIKKQELAEYGFIFSLVCVVTLVVLKTMGN